MGETKSKRIEIIDALRGFALAGVALVHMKEQYIASMPSEGLMEVENTLFDQILGGFIDFFIIGKFFALFSLLFGLSFYIQMKSASDKNENFAWRFLWRVILLFGIGYVHQLFYKGDILTIYAMLAVFLIPFYQVSKKWILITAILFLVSIPRGLSFLLLNETIFDTSLVMNPDSAENIAYLNTLKNGSILEVFNANATTGFLSKMNFQLGIFARFYLTFGYFLIGLLIGKITLFINLQDKVKTIRKVLYISIICFVCFLGILALIFTNVSQPIDFNHWLPVLGINVYDWSNMALTAIIFCSFLLIFYKRQKNQIFKLYAYYGRMALTNYVLQSVIGTSILFGWGLGYLGKLHTYVLVIIAVVIILLQMLFSRFWLTQFRYGPLEWLWRSATLGKLQPLRRL